MGHPCILDDSRQVRPSSSALLVLGGTQIVAESAVVNAPYAEVFAVSDCPVFGEYKSFDLVLSGVTCSCSRCAEFEEFWTVIIKRCHILGVSADCSDSVLHDFEAAVCLALAKTEGFTSDLRMISRSESYCDLVAQIIGGAVGEVGRMLADCPRTNEGYAKRSKIWEFFVQMVCNTILDGMRELRVVVAGVPAEC